MSQRVEELYVASQLTVHKSQKMRCAPRDEIESCAKVLGSATSHFAQGTVAAFGRSETCGLQDKRGRACTAATADVVTAPAIYAKP
jgi:hypothetical protein